jgi:ATP-dependent RNA helicase DOB1
VLTFAVLYLQETEVNALLMKKMNFNSDEEAVLVKQVYTNALESLADEDRTLPQVLDTCSTIV